MPMACAAARNSNCCSDGSSQSGHLTSTKRRWRADSFQMNRSGAPFVCPVPAYRSLSVYDTNDGNVTLTVLSFPELSGWRSTAPDVISREFNHAPDSPRRSFSCRITSSAGRARPPTRASGFCHQYTSERSSIHNDISPAPFVIPRLARRTGSFWIHAFAGMTDFAVISVAVYKEPLPSGRGTQMQVFVEASSRRARCIVWFGVFVLRPARVQS
jgi:hypothetical protein